MYPVKWKAVVRIGLATLCGLASCSRVPSLTPHVSYVEIRHQIEQASLIVVGVVQSEHVVRTVDSGPKQDLGRLELRAVRLQVEGVLEGQFDGDHLTFYYYQVTAAWDGPEPNMITPGERGIFYLVKDGEIWRATTDAYASHTRLVTGKHSISLATSKDEVRKTIARLLLLPAEGTDLNGFLGSLHRDSALAMALVSKMEVSQMLQILLRNPNADIRGRACIALAEYPLKERSCLPDVIHDVRARPEDRKRAEELMRQN
jgi:hypothetical protein